MGNGCGLGFGSGQAMMVWAMICHAFAMVWMVTLMDIWLGYTQVINKMLMDLVLLKKLVNSLSYALLKNLICSNLNYLCMVGTMTSKGIKVSRIALKCEIGLL